MEYQLRNSGGPRCAECDSTEMILKAVSSEKLTELVEANIESLANGLHFWNVIKKRDVKKQRILHARLIETLRRHSFLA